MSDQYVPKLRQRFLEDIRIKGLLPKTQTMYLPAMREFTRLLGHSPDTATPEDLRALQLDMKERGVGAPTFNNRLTVLSFFFATTCPRAEMKRHMRLPADEFMRRVLIHVLPFGFHRIRHAAFLANGIRRDRIAKIRHLIDRAPEPDQMAGKDARAEAHAQDLHQTCPKSGGEMRVIETFTRGQTPKSRAPPWEDAE